MTAETLAPVDFLTERYDEEQAFLEQMIAVEQPTHVGGDQYEWEGGPVHYSAPRPGGSQVFLSTYRALADIKVDRAILALHSDPDQYRCPTCGDDDWEWDPDGDGDEVAVRRPEQYPCRTLRLLVSKFAEHPDCRPEWLPV